MKKNGQFEVNFFGQGEVDNFAHTTYKVDGVDMFRPDSGGSDCFDRAGFIRLEGLVVGKMFSLTIPSGQLAGRIVEVQLESRTEQGLMGGDSAPITTIVIDGSWRGARNGLLCGESAAASFRQIGGLSLVERKYGTESRRWNLPTGATVGLLQDLVPDHWDRKGEASGFDLVNPDGVAHPASAGRLLRLGDIIGGYPGRQLSVE